MSESRTLDEAGTAIPGDAALLAMLATLRKLEGACEAACRATDDLSDDPTITAISDAQHKAIANMTSIPATTLLGAAAKAARLCESLASNGGYSIMFAEATLAQSLARDLARLAPEVVAAAGQPLPAPPLDA